MILRPSRFRRLGAGLFAVAFAAPLSGCLNERSPLFVSPPMSPVGSGFVANTDPALLNELAPTRHPSGSSLFVDGAANLFTDLRAMKVGDVITIVIRINDKATFGNTTGRSQTAQETLGFSWSSQPDQPEQSDQRERQSHRVRARRTDRGASTAPRRFSCWSPPSSLASWPTAI